MRFMNVLKTVIPFRQGGQPERYYVKIIFYLILSAGIDLYIATMSGLVVATGLRLVAMKLNWNLPKVKGNF